MLTVLFESVKEERRAQRKNDKETSLPASATTAHIELPSVPESPRSPHARVGEALGTEEARAGRARPFGKRGRENLLLRLAPLFCRRHQRRLSTNVGRRQSRFFPLVILSVHTDASSAITDLHRHQKRSEKRGKSIAADAHTCVQFFFSVRPRRSR